MTNHLELAGLDGGPTLVFLHGAGINRKMWAPQVDLLSPSYRIVAVDLPGHGALRDRHYDFEDAVSVVTEAIELHTAGEVVLIGLSLGGYVALGVSHPRVGALILSGASAAYAGWGGLSTKLYGWAITPVAPFLNRLNEKALRKALGEVAEEIIHHGLAIREAVRALRKVPGPDYRGMLARFEGPVLLLNGERDKPNRGEEVDAASVGRDVTIVVVEDAGHACSLTQPEAFSDAVDRFCANRVFDR